jgi:general secretion pathway protein A
MKPHQHFGLTRSPFELMPDPRVFCGVGGYGETLAALEYTVSAYRTCTIVLGESGSGKTLLARLAAARASKKTTVLWVYGIGQPENQTEISVYAPGALTKPIPELAQGQTTLSQWVRCNQRLAEAPLLIVDDADELPAHGWRDLISLLSREIQFPRSVNLILFATPEFVDTLASPELTRLRRRVFRTCALGRLNRQQIAEYVECRVAAVGGQASRLFTAAAISHLLPLTKGNPGLINQVCDNALLEAFSQGRKRIASADVVAAARAIIGALHVLPTGRGASLALGGPARPALPMSDAPVTTPTAEPPAEAATQPCMDQAAVAQDLQEATPATEGRRFEDGRFDVGREDPSAAPPVFRSCSAVKPMAVPVATEIQVSPSDVVDAPVSDTTAVEVRLEYLEKRLAQALRAVHDVRRNRTSATDASVAPVS